MSIGVFDSGLGGLSIFREILKILPEYNYIYLGDNARVPYGGRSADLIYKYTKDAVEFLFKKKCQLVILACNAATSNALHRLQNEYLVKSYPDRRILGVIRPVVEIAAEDECKRIGVLGTRATISSKSYPKEFKKLNSKIRVYQEACPLLVPIIEENEIEWEGTDLIMKKYLAPLLKNRIDGLILGCTHYGLIKDRIRKHLPDYIKIISQGEAAAVKLADYLKRHPEHEKKLAKKAMRTFFVTDLNQRFETMTKLFMGEHFDHDAKLQFILLS